MARNNEILKNSTAYYNSNLFNATVVSCNPGNTVIEIAPDGQQSLQKIQGIPLANIFATALGFKETVLPTIGSRVFCQGLGGNIALIIGIIPQAEIQGDGTTVNMPAKITLGAQEPIHDAVHRLGYLKDITKLNVTNNQLPTDVVQGEKVIANEFGVMLGLFQLVAMLRGSDLAQVQCHFLDDLVRIISHNFQHYTALGELSVSHDGSTINLEASATHDPAESLGQSSEAAAINPIDATTATTSASQFYDLTKNARALERLKLFVGKLGGFINLLICNPADITHLMDGSTPTTPDDGLLQIKANLDGSLIVRSANGIYLEKTNWIRVPQRIRAVEDPAGDGPAVVYPTKDAFSFNDDHTYRNTAFLYYLQLRDYLAYTNEELGYTDFKALTKDFYVNDDITKNQLADLATVFVDPLTGATYQRTKSIVALMPNGGVSMSDNWGSCIAMEGGNIYIQPAKDLVIQPNRNIVAKVGGNVSIAAKGELDLSSTTGGMRVKTNTAQYFYSDNNGILLHANGPALSKGVLPFSKDIDTITNVSGVVFNAPNSTITGNAEQVYFNAIDTLALSGPQLTMYSPELIRMYSKQDIVMNSNVLESTTNNSTVFFSQNSLIAVGVVETIIGTKTQTFATADGGDFAAPVKGLLDPVKDNKPFFDSMKKVSQDANSFALKSVLESFTDTTQFDDIAFNFLPSKFYNLTAADVWAQSLSQQLAPISGIPTTNWVEVAVNGSYPYPGTDYGTTGLVTIANNNTTVYQGQLTDKVTDLSSDAGDVSILNVFTDYKITI